MRPNEKQLQPFGSIDRTSFDVFIAHATTDYAIARRIYDRLAGYCRVWLADDDHVLPGDDFDTAIAKAQAKSLITAVIVSEGTEDAFYQREEVASAISYAREDPMSHRVVPIYLDGRPKGRQPIPYGLRLKSGLDVPKLGSIEAAAERILKLVRVLRKGGGAVGVSLPVEPDPETVKISGSLAEALDKLERSHLSGSVVQVRAAEKEVETIRFALRRTGQLMEGDILKNRYALRRVLGAGGFATAWLAYDREMMEDVTVKVLRSERAAGDSYEKFFRGASMMAGLDHPGIVSTIETRCEDHGHFFIVLEYIAGRDLEKLAKAGVPDVERVCRIIEDVGSALAYAHARDIIHRDVKPANILIDKRGKALLSDFDLARHDLGASATTTEAFGTLMYTAPELFASPKNASKRSDIYSLAMTIAYVLSAGRLEVLPAYAASGEVPVADALDSRFSEVQRVLSRALSRDPEKRHKTVTEFVADAVSALRTARRAPAPEPKRREGRTGPTQIGDSDPPVEDDGRLVVAPWWSRSSIMAAGVGATSVLAVTIALIGKCGSTPELREPAKTFMLASLVPAPSPPPVVVPKPDLDVVPATDGDTKVDPPPKPPVSLSIAIGGEGCLLGRFSIEIEGRSPVRKRSTEVKLPPGTYAVKASAEINTSATTFRPRMRTRTVEIALESGVPTKRTIDLCRG